jgi:hypothetical protein
VRETRLFLFSLLLSSPPGLPHERPVYCEGAIIREKRRNFEVLECPLGIKDNY